MPLNKKDVIELIRCILVGANSGISVSALNKEFKNETGIDIPTFGHGNISDFLHSLPNIVKLTGIYPIERVTLIDTDKSGDIKFLVDKQNSLKNQRVFFPGIYFSKKTQNNDSCRKQRALSPGGERNINDSREEKRSQHEMLHYDHVWKKESFCSSESTAPIMDINLHAKVGKYIEIYVHEIITPYKFYFHLRKFKNKLSSFMSDLQAFYKNIEGIPSISASLIKAKQLCAALHETDEGRMWYRAEIQSKLSDSDVLVNFIDFGEVTKIPIKNLKFLHKNFISYPRQICLGFLVNIVPLNSSSNWPSPAVERFCDLALGRDLVAGVDYIDPETSTLGLALSLTNGLEIHVNDILVEEGFAKFGRTSNKNLAANAHNPSQIHESQHFVEKSELSLKK